LRFADDRPNRGKQQQFTGSGTTLERVRKAIGPVINKAKTQTMVFGNDNIDQPVKIDDYTLKNVTWFTYLGSDI